MQMYQYGASCVLVSSFVVEYVNIPNVIADQNPWK